MYSLIKTGYTSPGPSGEVARFLPGCTRLKRPPVQPETPKPENYAHLLLPPAVISSDLRLHKNYTVALLVAAQRTASQLVNLVHRPPCYGTGVLPFYVLITSYAF
jgi:hypothetical protein